MEKMYTATGRRRARRALQSCSGNIFNGGSPCTCSSGDVPADVTNDCQATPADAQATAYYMVITHSPTFILTYNLIYRGNLKDPTVLGCLLRLLPCVRTYCPLHRSQPIKDGLWTPLTTGPSPGQHALSTPTARPAPIPVLISSTFSDT